MGTERPEGDLPPAEAALMRAVIADLEEREADARRALLRASFGAVACIAAIVSPFVLVAFSPGPSAAPPAVIYLFRLLLSLFVLGFLLFVPMLIRVRRHWRAYGEAAGEAKAKQRYLELAESWADPRVWPEDEV